MELQSDQGAESSIHVVLVWGQQGLVSASPVSVPPGLGVGELLDIETSNMDQCRARVCVGPVLAQKPGPSLSVAAWASPSFVLDL
jgi:hypothetical protein